MGVSLVPIMTEIVRVIDEAPNVKTFYISLTDYQEPMPGQYNMIYVRGFGEVPISVSGIYRRGGKLILGHTVRAIGSVTQAFFNKAEVGTYVGIRGPYGNGWPLKESVGRDVMIVAGGIGMAPLRPVVEYIREHRNDYGKFILLYGARTPMDLLYKYELNKYRAIPNSIVRYSIDKPYPGWYEYVGFVTDLINMVDVDPKNTIAYVCGPEIMIKVATRILLNKGFKKDDIYVSLERRMRCGVGLCGTCQLGHLFVCKNGPIFNYSVVEDYLKIDGL